VYSGVTSVTVAACGRVGACALRCTRPIYRCRRLACAAVRALAGRPRPLVPTTAQLVLSAGALGRHGAAHLQQRGQRRRGVAVESGPTWPMEAACARKAQAAGMKLVSDCGLRSRAGRSTRGVRGLAEHLPWGAGIPLRRLRPLHLVLLLAWRHEVHPPCPAVPQRVLVLSNTPKSSSGRFGIFAAVSNRGRETAALRPHCPLVAAVPRSSPGNNSRNAATGCPDFAISTLPLHLHGQSKSCTCERVTRHHHTGWPAELQPSPAEYSARQLAASDTPAHRRGSVASRSHSLSCAMAAAMAHQAAAADDEAVRAAKAPVCRKHGGDRCCPAGWRAHLTCQPPSKVK
jgi:hypothetical protein